MQTTLSRPDVDPGLSAPSRASIWLVLGLIVGIPLTFAIVSQGVWLLDFGGVDNWIYVKYFQIWNHVNADLRPFTDDNYKAVRIPWILPGFLAYQAFGPILGTFVLHLTVLIGGTVCYWLSARRLFGEGTATVTTLLLLANPGYHGSGITLFWNYHGQAALTYYLLAMLGVAGTATSQRPLRWAALAGAGLAGCLGTSLTFLALMPAFAVLALMAQQCLSLRRLLAILAGGLLGAAATFALFGIPNMLVGGKFFFIWRQFTYMLEWTDATATPPPVGSWFPGWFAGAHWLGLPPLVALVSLPALVPLLRGDRGDWRRRLVIGCILHLLLAWAGLIFGELRGQPVLRIAYIYQMMLGPTIYTLAALIWLALGFERRPFPAWTIAVLALGLVIPQLLLTPEMRVALRDALDLSRVLPVLPSGFWATAILLIGSLSALVFALRAQRVAFLVPASLAVGIAFATTPLFPSAYQPPDRCSYVWSQFKVIQNAIFWSSTERVDANTLLWYNPRESVTRSDPDCPPIPLFSIYDAIHHGSTMQLASEALPTTIAEVRPTVMQVAAANRWNLVLLTSPQTADQAAESLQTWLRQARVRAVARPRQQIEIADGDVAVVMQVFSLRSP